MSAVDARFDLPLYTVGEVARHLGMNEQTLRRWTRKDGLIHTVPAQAVRGASLPFIAMAEAQFYRQLRGEGISLQAITAGMRAVRRELGDQMLVRGRIAHDGKDILMRLGSGPDVADWTRARDMQGGLEGVIERGLRPIEWAADDLPQRVHLTAYEGAEVVVDPRFVFGQPMIADRGVRTEDVLDMFLAGDAIEDVADEFGIEQRIVEAIVRVHARAAA